MKRITVLRADGTTENLPDMPDLKKMQEVVGGYIEIVRVMDHIDENGRPVLCPMVVNENGLIDDLPRNTNATIHYQRLSRYQFPDAPNPFQAACEAMRNEWLKNGLAFIKPSEPTPGYNDDPFIAGDAILFQGYDFDEL